MSTVRTSLQAVLLCGAALALAACGDKEQTIGSNIRQDATPYAGTGKPYAAPGWKAGDKVSWEQQLRTRTQSGQNDYTRTN